MGYQFGRTFANRFSRILFANSISKSTGHNSEGKYFTTGNKIAFNCELSPRKIVVFIEKSREGHVQPVDEPKIVDVACGINHTLAIDTKKRCFSEF